MSEVSLTVSTSAQMRALGRSLGAVLRAGDLVILSGGLGAGKTTLTQGIGDGLGVRGPITSPTFVIARVHPPLGAVAATGELRPALVHADALRVGAFHVAVKFGGMVGGWHCGPPPASPASPPPSGRSGVSMRPLSGLSVGWNWLS